MGSLPRITYSTSLAGLFSGAGVAVVLRGARRELQIQPGVWAILGLGPSGAKGPGHPGPGAPGPGVRREGLAPGAPGADGRRAPPWAEHRFPKRKCARKDSRTSPMLEQYRNSGRKEYYSTTVLVLPHRLLLRIITKIAPSSWFCLAVGLTVSEIIQVLPEGRECAGLQLEHRHLR